MGAPAFSKEEKEKRLLGKKNDLGHNEKRRMSYKKQNEKKKKEEVFVLPQPISSKCSTSNEQMDKQFPDDNKRKGLEVHRVIDDISYTAELAKKDGAIYKSLISTSIGLLASFAGTGNQLYSHKVIGFSLTGTGKRRQNIIKQCKRNLPQLNQVQDHGLAWSPGNCAESETFACYKNMHESLKKRCGQFTIFTVSLTLSISQGFPIPFYA